MTQLRIQASPDLASDWTVQSTQSRGKNAKSYVFDHLARSRRTDRSQDLVTTASASTDTVAAALRQALAAQPADCVLDEREVGGQVESRR